MVGWLVGLLVGLSKGAEAGAGPLVLPIRGLPLTIDKHQHTFKLQDSLSYPNFEYTKVLV